jgi:hypothetical protein
MIYKMREVEQAPIDKPADAEQQPAAAAQPPAAAIQPAQIIASKSDPKRADEYAYELVSMVVLF